MLFRSGTDMAPMYFRKGAHEGKRYTVDEVFYSYSGGRCHLKQKGDNLGGGIVIFLLAVVLALTVFVAIKKYEHYPKNTKTRQAAMEQSARRRRRAGSAWLVVCDAGRGAELPRLR